jgi:hypothetical protein
VVGLHTLFISCLLFRVDTTRTGPIGSSPRMSFLLFGRFFFLFFLPIICLRDLLIAANSLTSVRIGGFFAPLSPSSHLYKDQAEHLAAFMMAVNDINNKTDGIYDDILPGITIEVAVSVENSVTSAAANAVNLGSAFGGDGVVATVNTLHNEEALIVAQLITNLNAVSVLTVANSGRFNDPAAFPFAAHIRPMVSRQGMVLQNVLCLSTARKVVVLAGTDPDDIQMMSQFQDESICELDILAVISVRAELSDFTYEIEQAIPTGSRYFVMFLPARQNALMIEQGYAAGLFHDNTVLYTTINGATNITHHFSPETDIARMLTGFFYAKFYPNYYMGRTAASRDFAHRWRLQQSRAARVENDTTICDSSMDDNGNYLYQVVTNNGATCTGLNFNGYKESGSNIHPYTALTYDGTMLIALALDLAIRWGLNYRDPHLLFDLMVHNVSFSGASGPLDLFKGYAEYSYDGKGNRNAGTQYAIYDFDPDLFSNGSDGYMVKVGVFDGNNRTYMPCVVDDHTCFAPTYSAMTQGSYNIPPLDTPPVIIKGIPRAFSAMSFAMAAIIVTLVLVFGLFILLHPKSKIVKASQPTLLWCILLGGTIAAVRIALGGVPKSVGVCAAEIWSGHMAFIVMIGSLFVKAYRVHCVVNTKTLLRVTFTTMQAARMLFVICFAMVAYLLITHLVGQPQLHHQTNIVANQETDFQFCGLQYPQFQTALFVLEGFILAFSFRVCWQIRHVPDVVNESKQISTGFAIVFIVLCDLDLRLLNLL